MRLLQLFEDISAVDRLRANPPVDDRSDRDRIEDEDSNRVYPNPLPFMSPRDPRWIDWHDRGDEAVHEYMEQHGLEWRKGDAGQAKSAISQTMVLPISQLISTERFLDPEGLQRQAGDKFSSPRPVIYKVDGNYLITDGNHRIVQAYLNRKSEMEVDVIDVDAYEGRAAA